MIKRNCILLIAALMTAMPGCASRTDIIAPGDRLEVKFGADGSGSFYGVSQLSVLDTNGTIPIGDCAHVRLEGMSPLEATNAIREAAYVANGKTNKIRDVSVRKIAQVPAPLSLAVRRSGESNVVFRLTNNTTNSFRLPSDGYAFGDSYTPTNLNPAYSIVRRPEANIGLFLTCDWHYVGTNWFFASPQKWKHRLKIRTLRPGDHLDIIRSLGPFASPVLTDTNGIIYFNFQIPQDWAETYGLWEGSLCVTNLTERAGR